MGSAQETQDATSHIGYFKEIINLILFLLLFTGDISMSQSPQN